MCYVHRSNESSSYVCGVKMSADAYERIIRIYVSRSIVGEVLCNGLTGFYTEIDRREGWKVSFMFVTQYVSCVTAFALFHSYV